MIPLSVSYLMLLEFTELLDGKITLLISKARTASSVRYKCYTFTNMRLHVASSTWRAHEIWILQHYNMPFFFLINDYCSMTKEKSWDSYGVWRAVHATAIM
jgi:hypothetical protein